MSEGMIEGKEYQAPHCNSEVLHAPGTCIYCDHFPDRQAQREASGGAFTPAEANGWSGNTAVQAGVPHTHMGATFTPQGDSTTRCSSTDLGYQCEARVRAGDPSDKHFGFHHFGARTWAPADFDVNALLASIEPPERKRRRTPVAWLAEKMGF